MHSGESRKSLINKGKIGVTGFEPATSRPPAVRSNQTEPHPASRLYYMRFSGDCKEKYDNFVNFYKKRGSGRRLIQNDIRKKYVHIPQKSCVKFVNYAHIEYNSCKKRAIYAKKCIEGKSVLIFLSETKKEKGGERK